MQNGCAGRKSLAMQRRYAGMREGWILALTAAVFLALGPALAPVLSLSSKGRAIEICTAFGAVKMAVAGDIAPDHDGNDASGHCLFCYLRQMALLPPQSPALPVSAGFTVFLLVPDVLALVPHDLPLSYNQRAPPVFS